MRHISPIALAVNKRHASLRKIHISRSKFRHTDSINKTQSLRQSNSIIQTRNRHDPFYLWSWACLYPFRPSRGCVTTGKVCSPVSGKKALRRSILFFCCLHVPYPLKTSLISFWEQRMFTLGKHSTCEILSTTEASSRASFLCPAPSVPGFPLPTCVIVVGIITPCREAGKL